jgi:choline dehydrogenase-like flavoprotein
VPDADGRITRAEVAGLDGRRAGVTARHYVLAAGAVENSRLLLLSRFPSGASPGNDHDQLGRFFMEHPVLDLDGVVLGGAPAGAFLRVPGFRVAGARFRRDVRLGPEAQAQERILNHSLFLLEAEPAAAAEGLGERIVELWERLGSGTAGGVSRFACRIRLEHAPHAESRVMLSDQTDALGARRARVSFHFGALEKRTLLRVSERFARALGETGLGRMRLAPEDWSEGWIERMGWQSHHMGGTRMHESPRHGVVDPQGRVHGTANLWAAGASVFPTVGQANPTMNLVALTLRLGDHLAEVLR